MKKNSNDSKNNIKKAANDKDKFSESDETAFEKDTDKTTVFSVSEIKDKIDSKNIDKDDMTGNKNSESDKNMKNETDKKTKDISDKNTEESDKSDSSDDSDISVSSKNSNIDSTDKPLSHQNSSFEKTEIHKSKTKKHNINKGGRIAVAAASAIILASAAGYGLYVNSYDDIMPNTYIANVNLGGMTQEEALNALSQEYSEDKLEGKTINFLCMGDKSTIEVKNLAMQFKPEQMASDAYLHGREKTGFWSKLSEFTQSILGKHEIRPALTYDEQALIGSINDICSPHEREPLGYTFRVADSSNIVIAKPQDGIKVNIEKAVEKVEDEICTFNFGDIEFVPETTKAPKLDIDEFYNYITAPAEDATYAKDENNKVYVVPGKPQIVVNKSDIEAAVKQSEIEYSVPVQIVNSAVDADFLQSILYEDTLGSYSTNYGGSSAARASNIRTASNTINGIELLPGEQFDFNKIVGERKASTGYLQAPVYVVKNGETVSELDYGGGICQVSSTIYCAIARAGLKVITRVSHSKDVSYVPAGMDATVSWGGPEFIFKNSTDYPIRIFVDANGGILTVRVVGSIVKKPNVVLDVQNDGSSVTVTKTTVNSDGSQTSEVISSKTPPTQAPVSTDSSINQTSEAPVQTEVAE